MESSRLVLKDLREAVSRLPVDGALDHLILKLLELHATGLIKTTHAVLEIMVAAHLLLEGYYHVDVERNVDGVVCDVYAVGPWGVLAVEVETGFTPPSKALYPLTYHASKIAMKVLRLWSAVDEVVVAVPLHYLAPIPWVLTHCRSSSEAEALKSLLMLHYNQLEVDEDSLSNAVLSRVFLVDVDRGLVIEVPAEDYVKSACSILCRTWKPRSSEAYHAYYHSTQTSQVEEALKALCTCLEG